MICRSEKNRRKRSHHHSPPLPSLNLRGVKTHALPPRLHAILTAEPTVSRGRRCPRVSSLAQVRRFTTHYTSGPAAPIHPALESGRRAGTFSTGQIFGTSRPSTGTYAI